MVKPLQRKMQTEPVGLEFRSAGDTVDKAFRRLIDRMDREEEVQGEPLVEEGLPVVREC